MRQPLICISLSLLISACSAVTQQKVDFDQFANQLWQAEKNLNKDRKTSLPDMSPASLATQNQQRQQIQSLVVSDAPPYVVSYITCNKSAEGQHLITQINKVLEGLWQKSDYKTAMFYWVDEETKSRLESAYTEVQQQVLGSSELVKQ